MKFKNIAMDEEEVYVVVDVPEDILEELGFDLLDEGQWRQGEANLYYRIDPMNPSIPLNRHVHITDKKHISAKSRQVSWDDEGHRHDRGTFDTNFKGMERAKDLARRVLKLPDDVVIEDVKGAAEKLIFLYESGEAFPKWAAQLKCRRKDV